MEPLLCPQQATCQPASGHVAFASPAIHSVGALTPIAQGVLNRIGRQQAPTSSIIIPRAARLTASRVNSSKVSATICGTSFSACSSVYFDARFSCRMAGCVLLIDRSNLSSERQPSAIMFERSHGHFLMEASSAVLSAMGVGCSHEPESHTITIFEACFMDLCSVNVSAIARSLVNQYATVWP